MKGAILGVTLGALALAGCTAGTPRNTSGQVTAQASVDAFQVKLGDCTGALKEGDISGLQVIPCAEPHFYEAYATTDLTDAAYPGESDVTKEASKFCTGEFKTFIGLATKESIYDMFYLYPVEDSWATGDREVLCLVGSGKGKITGTLKGIEK